MRKIFSLLLITLSLAATFDARAEVVTSPYGDFILEPSGEPEAYLEGSTFYFQNPLSLQDKWTIHATSLYFGKPSGYWGSRIFQVVTQIATDTMPEFNTATNAFIDVNGVPHSVYSRDYPFTFYMRPPSGWPDTYQSSQNGKILLCNTAWWNEEVQIDTVNGTLFMWDVISDGTGNVSATLTVNGKFLTKQYPNGVWTANIGTFTIESIKGICAGSYYPVEVSITSGDATPVIIVPETTSFGEVLAGGQMKKTVEVKGINIPTATYTITGPDAAAFTPSSGIVNVGTAGGSIEVTFSPTDKKAYNAAIEFTAEGAETVTTNLTGNANFDLPITVSDDNEEHWYYIQFERAAAKNVAITSNGELQMLTQDTLVADNQAQQWKIVGAWDQYRIVNRKYNTEWKYFDTGDGGAIADDAYVDEESLYGDEFRFVRFGTDEPWTWQLYNMWTAENGWSYGYVNDKSQTRLCAYSKNDAGNQLRFIPADVPFITTSSKDLNVGEAMVGEMTDKTFSVTGLSLTGGITATLTGDDASVFSLSTTTLPAEGGSIEVIFAPTAQKLYTATLTLSSDGAEDAVVTLTGNSDLGLPLFSNNGVDTWYYIQFYRKSTRSGFETHVITNNGEGVDLSQTPKLEGSTDQYWKFTGTKDDVKIVGYDGLEWSFNENARYTVVPAGTGDTHAFYRQSSTSRWQLYNTNGKYDDDDETCNYVNDFGGGDNTEVGFYYENDGGNDLVFTAVFETAVNYPKEDGIVIARQYYTLQGFPVKQPATTGVYIVKEQLSSGKYKVTKRVFIVK